MIVKYRNEHYYIYSGWDAYEYERAAHSPDVELPSPTVTLDVEDAHALVIGILRAPLEPDHGA